MSKQRFLTADDFDLLTDEIGLHADAMLTHVHGWDSITDKPELFSGSYLDLTDAPSLFSGSYLDLSDVPDPVDLSDLEDRLDVLEGWKDHKVSALAASTISPTAATVTLLGIQIPTSLSFSGLVSDVISLRNSHNALLAAAKEWGWMET